MFRFHSTHGQAAFRSDLDLLSKKSRARLETSWAGAFYREYFCRVDEGPFAVLYAKTESRPNIPVNVLLSLEAIKAARSLSDEELYEAFLYDVQLRYAIGYRNLGEGDFDLRTLYNFRRRLLLHQVQTGEDLVVSVFSDVTGKQMKALGVKSGRLRVDSTQVSSNIRQMSRLQLLVEVIQRVHRMLTEADRAVYSEAFAPYLIGTSGHFVYRVKGEQAWAHIRGIGELMQRLVAELATLYGEKQTYQILCRVFQEQFVVVSRTPSAGPAVGSGDAGVAPVGEPTDVALASEALSEAEGPEELPESEDAAGEPEIGEGAPTQSSAVEWRPGEEVSPARLRSPDDPDATYRRKGSRGYEGYATTITETCDRENPLQLIVKVQTDSNTKNDAEFLREALPDLKERTEVHTIYTDAGFCSRPVDESMRSLDLTQVPTGLRGHAPRPDQLSLADFQFHLDDAGRPITVTCPHGHTATVEAGTTVGRYLARLPECCRPSANTGYLRGQKKGVVLRFDHSNLEAALRRQRCRAYYQEGYNLRSAIEATIGAMKRPFNNDKLPVRGKARMAMMLVSAATMVNIRRIHRYLTAQAKARRPEAEKNPAILLVSAIRSRFALLGRRLNPFRRPLASFT